MKEGGCAFQTTATLPSKTCSAVSPFTQLQDGDNNLPVSFLGQGLPGSESVHCPAHRDPDSVKMLLLMTAQGGSCPTREEKGDDDRCCWWVNGIQPAGGAFHLQPH